MRILMIILASVLTASLAAGTANSGAVNPCADYAGSTPELDAKTGALKGCRITAVEKGSVLERLGIKKGDLVKPQNSEPGANDGPGMGLHDSSKNSTIKTH